MFKKIFWKEGKQRILYQKVKITWKDMAKNETMISYADRYYPQKKWFIFWTNYTREIELFPLISRDVVFDKKEDALHYVECRK